MSQKGYIDALLNTLPAELKRVLIPAFQHVMDTWRLGDSEKATNAAWYRFETTTSSVAGTEFSIQHGLNQTPNKLIPVLDLSLVDSQTVSLTVTRASDKSRVYLSSPTTSATLVVYLEV